MDHIQCIQMLKLIRNYQQRYLESCNDKRRKLRPSERAMAMAQYAMNIEALTYAIEKLEPPLETKLTEVILHGEDSKN